MIAALAKAESLHKFASASGCPLDTFLLVLSNAEGLELLDYFKTEYQCSELFDMDVAIAQAKGDPWGVLDNFVLLGLHMAPASLVLN
jgi:hypothetical protein